MGKLLSLMAGVIVFTSSPYLKAQETGFLTNGLIAYYPFDGDANDRSGYERNATIYGPTLVADRFGNLGQAYRFNGSNDYMRVYDGRGLPRDRDDFTVALWVSVSPDWASNEHRFLIAHDVQQWDFFVGSRYPYSVEFYTGDSRVGGTTGLSWEPNQWYQLAFVRTGGEDADIVTWYRDGLSIATNTTAAGNDALTADEGLTIGRRLNGYGPWSGSMDDIRIYNRALTPAEIHQLYAFEALPVFPIVGQRQQR